MTVSNPSINGLEQITTHEHCYLINADVCSSLGFTVAPLSGSTYSVMLNTANVMAHAINTELSAKILPERRLVHNIRRYMRESDTGTYSASVISNC